MIRKIFPLLIIVLFATAPTRAQQVPVDESLIEVGIVERLGETIPLSLEFINESNDTVTLGALIDKPTILQY